jgi:hypothetical protein
MQKNLVPERVILLINIYILIKKILVLKNNFQKSKIKKNDQFTNHQNNKKPKINNIRNIQQDRILYTITK